jgi:hypothetical protein
MRKRQDSAATIPIDTTEFEQESPTSPANVDLTALARGSGSFPVDASVPLDAIPALAIDRNEAHRYDLSTYESLLITRMDGVSTLMQIVSDGLMPADEGSRLLAKLVRRGIARLQ